MIMSSVAVAVAVSSTSWAEGLMAAGAEEENKVGSFSLALGLNDVLIFFNL